MHYPHPTLSPVEVGFQMIIYMYMYVYTIAILTIVAIAKVGL